MDRITFSPIGFIRTPYSQIDGMPIQPCGAESVTGTIEIHREFEEGLHDLEGFSHIWLIYHLHERQQPRLRVKPFLDDVEHGIFSTRSPVRPNAIGLSLVKLVKRQGCTLTVENIDVLDGTPLLDIKPYVPAFDSAAAVRIGWFENKVGEAVTTRADRRFA